MKSVRFRDRWDASVMADVRLWRLFRLLDASWRRLPLPIVTSQLTSSARYLALWLGRALDARSAPEERSELLVVAERQELPAADR